MVSLVQNGPGARLRPLIGLTLYGGGDSAETAAVQTRAGDLARAVRGHTGGARGGAGRPYLGTSRGGRSCPRLWLHSSIHAVGVSRLSASAALAAISRSTATPPRALPHLRVRPSGQSRSLSGVWRCVEHAPCNRRITRRWSGPRRRYTSSAVRASRGRRRSTAFRYTAYGLASPRLRAARLARWSGSLWSGTSVRRVGRKHRGCDLQFLPNGLRASDLGRWLSILPRTVSLRSSARNDCGRCRHRRSLFHLHPAPSQHRSAGRGLQCSLGSVVGASPSPLTGGGITTRCNGPAPRRAFW